MPGFSQSDSSTNIKETKSGDVRQGDIQMPSAMDFASGHGSRGITLNFGAGSGTSEGATSSSGGGKINWWLIGGAGAAVLLVVVLLLRRKG